MKHVVNLSWYRQSSQRRVARQEAGGGVCKRYMNYLVYSIYLYDDSKAVGFVETFPSRIGTLRQSAVPDMT